MPDMLEAQRAQAGQVIANQGAIGDNTRRIGVLEHRLDRVGDAVEGVGKGVIEIKHSIELQQAIAEEAELQKKQAQQRTFVILGLLFTAINIVIQIASRLL